MFTSKQELIGAMGVEPDIAAFFVDRKVPVANQYWRGRYLYVARGTGYLFIPLFFDLQYKAGLSKEKVLDASYVSMMESILDLAARYEFGELDFRTHIARIEAIVRPLSVQPWLFDSLEQYFKQEELNQVGILGTTNPALNRGDALLYLLTTMQASREIMEKVIGYWYSLVPSFLLMDDIMDLKQDQAGSDESALAYYGFDAKGVQTAIDEVEKNFTRLGEVNPLLGQYFRNTLESKKKTPYFQIILKD